MSGVKAKLLDKFNKSVQLVVVKRNAHPLVSGFGFPIIVVLLLNLGLIFNWQPIIATEPFLSVINYLSKRIEFELPAEYFVGAITTFIIFFSFAQFSYSRQSVPANLIRKHILYHKNTWLFIGLQFSFSSIIAIFSFLSTCAIHNLNFILIFLTLLCSVSSALYYFYWLSKNVTAVGMFKLISDNLNVEEINVIETANSKNFQKFEKDLKSTELKLKYTLFDYFGFTTPEQIPIQTSKTGIISSIDVIKIDQILAPYKNVIHEIILDIKVGQPIPLYETYSSIKPNTVLMRIYTLLATTQQSKEKIEAFTEIVKDVKFNEELINCFKIDEHSQIFKTNKENIKELIQFYFYAVEMEPSESEVLIKELSSFIVSKINTLKAANQIKLTEKLFIEMIDVFYNKVMREDINTTRIEITLKFIYSMCNVAVEGKSYLLLSKLLSLLQLLFNKYLNSDLMNMQRLNSIVLNIQEIAFSSIVYSSRNISREGFTLIYHQFLLPLIRDSLTQSAIAYFSLVKYSLDHEIIGFRLMQKNAQHMLNLLSPFNHWQPLQELQFNDSKCYEEEKNKILRAHAQNIFHLSVYIFKLVEEKKLNSRYLTQIAFPLVDNCHTIEKYSLQSDELLDEFFFSIDVHEVYNSFLQEEFEINKVHESGTYTPDMYSFMKFWITYSIYRCKNGFKFIPSKNDHKSNYAISMIKVILYRLKQISPSELNLFINADDISISILLKKYESHLITLLK